MKKYLLLFFIFPAGLYAQTYASDTQSVDTILATLYQVIGGEPGEPRDWNRFKNLFAADAKLIPTVKNQDGKISYRALSPDEYIQLFSSRIPTGFFERELHRITEQFGTVTHAFSTYETRERKDGPVTNRGINSIQLFFDGTRYYIMNIFWCAESIGFTLPQNYLK
jgi:hypothetical protein